jgi:hypothetical protein
VQAQCAVATVVVVVGDVFECAGFESRVFHTRNVQPRSCGLLVYKSYSVLIGGILYKSVLRKRGTPQGGSVLAHQESACR